MSRVRAPLSELPVNSQPQEGKSLNHLALHIISHWTAPTSAQASKRKRADSPELSLAKRLLAQPLPPAPAVPFAVPAGATLTTRELAAVARSQARETWQRLVDGYTDKSGSGYDGAVTNEAGCLLAQKTANRDVSYPARTRAH